MSDAAAPDSRNAAASLLYGPPLDELRFAALRSEGGAGIIAELAAIFVEDMAVRLARLAAARDVEKRSQAAHAIKGAAGNIGAAPLAALAELIEKSPRRIDDEEMKRQIAALRNEFERVSAALAVAAGGLKAASGL